MSSTTENTKILVTHSGNFHLDETLGVSMLRKLTVFQDYKLVRSRKPEDFARADIIIDVGGEFDAAKRKFDHHQRSFNEYFFDEPEKQITKLSSAGLVYKYYGKEVISAILKDIALNDEQLKELYIKIYKDFIEAVDANDNGVSAYPRDIASSYNDFNLSLASVVSNLNPRWNETTGNDYAAIDAKFDECFLKAVDVIGSIFTKFVENVGYGWLPAKNIVKEAVSKRTEDNIVIFEQYVNWKEHLFNVEAELGIEGQINFVIIKTSNGDIRVNTVPVRLGSFDFRVGLPTNLRGLRDEELSSTAGIPDGVFVHSAGFIGGAKSVESCLKLARMGIEENKK
ncbi:related to UPF0160 protein YER156C [Hanseniaspora guilliermondii]|uniref:Related to UPF0160 protein YER156C n=1 Tax=Hanseniaspora guilliermondii TaxID=56406 RepID=A0A1L0CSA2_9ASCO|nr:related to UPF0160 protein YER156C [Hanseniaspora guilliermondii]